MSRVLLIILNIIFFVFADIAYADKIVAIVEDTSITLSGLEGRKKLLKYFNRIGNLSTEQEKIYTSMVLQSMIDDQVLLEYAKTVGIIVTPKEIDKFIDNIEKTGKLQSGTLTNQIVNVLHIPLSELRSKMKAEVLRSKIIRDSLSRNVMISQEDVESMVLATNFRDASLKLQIFTAKNDKEKTIKFMSSLPSRIKSCKNIKHIRYKAFADLTEISGKLSELAPSMQAIVKDLEVNEASNVIEDDQIRVLVVCEKTLDGFTLEDNNSIANFLGNKKLQIKAQKFFQDLRKKAYIKVMM
jgi:hypothetical protein